MIIIMSTGFKYEYVDYWPAAIQICYQAQLYALSLTDLICLL